MAIDLNQNQSNNQQGGTPKTQPRRMGFVAGGLFGAPVGRGIGSEVLNKIGERLNEIYKTSDPSFKMDVVIFDKQNEPALAYSAIAVTVRTPNTNSIAVHILLIEGTGERLSPTYEQFNGTQVEILKVTSDAMDKVLVNLIRDRIAKTYPNQQILIVDGAVVPEEFDPENKVMMHQLALNAALAGGTEVEIRDPQFRDINIADDGRGTNLVIDIGFEHKQVADAVGLPMRSDVLVQFRSQKTGQTQNQSVNSNDRDQQISAVSGFIDMMYAPVMVGGNQMAMAWQQQPQIGMTQTFAARLVITNLASNIGYTPGMVLLSLASALALNNDGNWIQNFRPMATGKEVDIYDVGVLNIEGKLEHPLQTRNNPGVYGEVPDTKSRDFTIEQLVTFMTQLVRPGLMISLDVPDCGPQTWYTSIFREASNGSQPALDGIIQAAMELTNGNFEKHFPAGTPMFVDVNNRVHLGYWTDGHGQKRDLRDIDYIATGNLIGRNNPEYMADWSNTFLRDHYPLQLRLAARKKMIENMTNMTAQFKGFATRVTFSAPFLNALLNGCREAGLVPQVKTPLSALDFNQQRGMANFATSALMSPGQQFGMSGFGGYTPAAYSNNLGYNRFG